MGIWNSSVHRRKGDKAVIHTNYGEQEVTLSTVGEFTGEVDKNGVKIFEGDIVECSSWNEYFTDTKSGQVLEPFRRKAVVEFRNAGFKLIERSVAAQGLAEERVWDFITDKDLVVIGNIYDNKRPVTAAQS